MAAERAKRKAAAEPERPRRTRKVNGDVIELGGYSEGTIYGAPLKAAIAAVTDAAGKPGTFEPFVHVEASEGELTFAATDRYRLAWRSVPWVGTGRCACLVEVADLRKAVDQLGVVIHAEASEEGLYFLGGGRASVRATAGKPFPWRSVVDKARAHPGELAFDAPALRAVLDEALAGMNASPTPTDEALALLSDLDPDERAQRVRAWFDEARPTTPVVTLQVSPPDQAVLGYAVPNAVTVNDDGQTRITTRRVKLDLGRVTWEADPLAVAFEARRLRSGLRFFDDLVWMRLGSATEAVMITDIGDPKGVTGGFLVMPFKL